MSKNLPKKANFFLSSLGYSKIKNIKEIKEGRNSQVFKLKIDQYYFLLKIYKDKKKLRINREKIFYKYLNKSKNNNTIKPIGFNTNLNMALYPYIDGKKIKKIKNNYIKKLVIFINQINKKNNLVKLPYAVDGIKNRKEHINLCEKKINQMKKVKINSRIKKDFYFFLNFKIIPKFIDLKKSFFNQDTNYLYKTRLLKNEMIISPSDFGFHNIIKSKNNLFFFDFEYAGLDDPVKLICDFYCQPEQSLTSLQKKKFIKNLSFKKHSSDQLEFLTKIFLPFHTLKWCCIMLNEFKNENNNSDIKKLKIKTKIMKKQLSKAKIYFNKNFENK